MSAVVDFSAASAADWADWTQLVVMHVMGHVECARGILKKNPWGVRRVAKVFHRTSPVKIGTLYRGLVLAPREIPARRLVQYKTGPSIVSYTDDPYVALWFADPASTISSDMRGKKLAGYFTERNRTPLKDIIFHYTWRTITTPDGPLDLGLLASTNPHIDALELEWNLREHKPVLTDRPSQDARFLVRPLVELPRPSTTELDQRFTYMHALR